MKCDMNRSGFGRCRGEVTQWAVAQDGNWRLPVEVHLCAAHEAVPFSVAIAAAHPTAPVGERARRTITHLRPPQ